MIKKLSITNFKSIKNIDLDCSKINIFIGAPNVGKSNILEALGFFSWPFYSPGGQLKNFVRFEQIPNLFYDEEINSPIAIEVDFGSLTLKFVNGSFEGKIEIHRNENQTVGASIQGDYNDLNAFSTWGMFPRGLGEIKFYRYSEIKQYSRIESDFLLPPNGDNLISVLQTHKDIRAGVNQIFSVYGLRLILKPQEKRIEVRKQLEDIDISYPYSLVSDTLQRMVFYQAAILSNKNSILIFEEPEAHTFPFYTKQMAEMIGLDSDNQYFISTHNPYFLGPLIEKTAKDDITVSIVYYQDYQTKIKKLDSTQLMESMETDIFSNIDRYLNK